MARSVGYTISYSRDGETVDLCKVLFGGDGSYYVTAPYHPLDRAIAAKFAVNYANESQLVQLLQSQELAVLEDDDQRLKVAHHPDGFLQFSGEGVLSGRDDPGAPKGVGTLSWPLHEPTYGPAFQLVFSDPVACGRPTAGRKDGVVFDEADIAHMRKGLAGLSLVGYYFPTRWREFVYREPDGRHWISVVHPSGQAVKRLRVLLAGHDADLSGLIGVEALPSGLGGDDDGPSFVLTTATGNLRRNEAGEPVAEQLLCAYPPPDLSSSASLPSLNFRLPTVEDAR